MCAADCSSLLSLDLTFLTCDIDFQSSASNGHDHTRAKKLKAKVSLLVRTVENKVETETDGQGGVA